MIEQTGNVGPLAPYFAEAWAMIEQHRHAGNLRAAGELCAQILAENPNDAEALHLFSLIAHQAGNLPDAVELLRRAVAADGSAALYHCNLGEMYRLAGRLDEAVAASMAALRLRPDYPEALNNLGIAHYDRGAFKEAADCCRRALALTPDYAEAHNNLGNALRAQRKLDEAISCYERAIALKPDYAEAHNNRGTALRDLKRLSEAEAAYRRALALKPDDTATLNNLALALIDLDRLDEALAVLAQSLALDPDNCPAHIHRAGILLERRKNGEARESLERALALAPDDPDVIHLMGRVLLAEGRAEQALAHLNRALALRPASVETHSLKGNALREIGRIGEAIAAYEQALALDPRSTAALLNLASTIELTPETLHFKMMEEMAARTDGMSDGERLNLHFALGKAYGDVGRHGEAFDHLLKGNALRRQKITYDETAALAHFDAIRAVFTPALMRQKTGGGDPSPVPVFILGMPRSGSTLTEQILGSHPEVFAAGELPDLHAVLRSVKGPDGKRARYPAFVPRMAGDQLRRLGEAYLRRVTKLAPHAHRITDKMPSNFLDVGLIHLMLPNARIIHTRRDPVDTCLSCFSKLFAGELSYTYDLGELGRYYRAYEGLMAHWRAVLPAGVMLEVQYEEVIADLETQARRIVAHAGLEWSDACLAFYQNKRPVKTASVAQVRRPIYKSAVGRWHPYRDLLTPLLAELQIEPAELRATPSFLPSDGRG